MVQLEKYYQWNHVLVIIFRKKLVRISKKKIDPNNRIYNKEMGGGVILDLGCYPVSFTSLIASIKSPIIFNNINFTDIENQICSTGVEVDSYLTLKFDNDFTSKIGASFAKNLGRKSEIIGSKGKIIIEDTWTAKPSKVLLKKKNKDFVYNFNSEMSIYSYEIGALSQFFLEKKCNNYQISTIDKSILNMRIIDAWKGNF